MSRTLTIKNVFGIVILSVFSALMVGTIIASVGIVYLPENDNNVTNFLALFIGQGFMVIPLLLFLIARKESFIDRLRIRKLPYLLFCQHWCYRWESLYWSMNLTG